MDLLQRYGDRTYAEGLIRAEIDDGVGLITFDRPRKRNAMTLAMWDGFGEVLEAFDADPAIRVVIITGAGHKAFLAGADIDELEAHHADPAAQHEYEQRTDRGWAAMANFSKPIIARIRGFCLGNGLALAMLADIRIAAHDSQFGMPGARMGTGYTYPVIRRLVGLVGQGHASKLLYTGARITAEEAERIGLVNQVVPDQDLSDVVADMARSIADNAPMPIAAFKLAITDMLKDPAAQDDEAVHRAVEACLESADYREGRDAFVRRRPPRFIGS
jgi:enoyl-CoA hydratase/carnithine racemase